MHNMWNTINNNLLFMGHKQFYGLNTSQKRHFGYDFPNVGNIVVGKSFNNPNFVNKDHPKVHNYQRTDNLTNFQTDTNGVSSDTGPYINSCQTIIGNIKEKQLNIVKPIHISNSGVGSSTKTSEAKTIMCNKRTNKKRMRSKKSHSLKKTDKSLKNRKLEINEMMEVDMEPQNCISDISMSPMEPHSLTLNDFLYNNSLEDRNGVNSAITESNESQDLAHLISFSPGTDCVFKRERANSTAESEDSFIVFESGTDDELEFSDNSLEGEYEDSSDEDELDSSPSVVPRKKVRFADDNELCQVHPMIMWSYAYQKARIGPWQKYAIDRVRFKDHIKNLEEKIKPVLDANHRDRIFQERFQCLEFPQ